MKPLVSFCVTCYNQAKYIRQALESVFAQTYEPLEIVICDDCSTDGTDAIIRAMVEEYKAKGGRHEVVFKRNEKNLNILKNYEQCFKMGRGELLFTGSGDDIQHPDRVEKTVEAWEKDGRKAGMISCAWEVIDEKGAFMRLDGPWQAGTPLGAAIAYRRGIVEGFPELPGSDVAYEDHIFSARALMLGHDLQLNEPLFSYRRGSGLSTVRNFRKQRSRITCHAMESLRILERDVEYAKANLPGADIEAAEKIMAWRRGRFGSEYQLITGNTAAERWRGYRGMKPEFGWKLDWRMMAFFYWPLLLPLHAGDLITASYEKYANFRRSLKK